MRRQKLHWMQWLYSIDANWKHDIIENLTLFEQIMNGKTMMVGAVGYASIKRISMMYLLDTGRCLKNIRKAASIARLVMEKTKHTLLVGEDGTYFL